MYTRGMRSGLFATFLFILLLPLAVSAQALDGSLGGAENGSFTVSVNPQYPAPYSQAIISILSSSLDLTSATMTITAASKKIYQGTVQPVAIQLGPAGSITTVGVTITSGGVSYSQTVRAQPQDVVLIAEPVSSAPPLYPGKPLIPLEGSVRVVAMANLKSAGGKLSNPNTYSYAWTVDGTQIANASGVGKKAIMVASPLHYRARDVSVAVVSPDGMLVGGASLSFGAEESLVRIYENDPLLGIRFERAISNQYSITGAEATLYAAPFSLPTTNGMPLLQWFLNGAVVQTGGSITLRPSGSGQGSASLSFVASANDYAKATTNLSISFGAKSGTNFFGL